MSTRPFRTLTFLLAYVYITIAYASSPSHVQPHGPGLNQPYIPAGPGDVRSPCPALNALANHGIIPRNGKDLTVPMLASAQQSVYNIAPDLAESLAQAGLNTAADNSTGKYNLDDLNKHGIIEQDVSLSRADIGDDFGDNFTFNRTIFDGVLQFFSGLVFTTIDGAARARSRRFKQESSTDKNLTFGDKEMSLSLLLSAIYLQAMGDANSATAKVEFVKIWFEDERLPIQEGWVRSDVPISMDTLNATMTKLIAATPDKELKACNASAQKAMDAMEGN